MAKSKDESLQNRVRYGGGLKLEPSRSISEENITKGQVAQLVEISKKAESFYDLYLKTKANKDLTLESLVVVGLMNRTELRRCMRLDENSIGEEDLESSMKVIDSEKSQISPKSLLSNKYVYIYGGDIYVQIIKSMEIPGIIRQVKNIDEINSNSTVLIFQSKNKERFNTLIEKIKKDRLKFIEFNEDDIFHLTRSEYIGRLNDVWI